MQKRGQVAVFVVIGLVIVILLVLLFAFRDTLVRIGKGQINTGEYLNSQLKDIQKNVIQKCAEDETFNAVKLYLDNGGKFTEPLNYLIYHGKKYRILCQNIPNDAKCLSSPLVINNVKEEFNSYLKEKISNCMDFKEFQDKNYELKLPSDLLLDVTINEDSLVVHVDYEIELVKDKFDVKSKKFVKKLDVPLGGVIKAVNQVLEFRNKYLVFDPVVFDAINRNKFVVDTNNPYPDELYTVYVSDYKSYKFPFAITSEGRYDRIEGSIR